MAMPRDLVFVRHGQSEANIVQKAQKAGHPLEIAQSIYDRPDWRQRLSPLGVEQARAAGRWLEKSLGGVAIFDARYVSSFLRARETAAYLGGMAATGWTIDDRLIERSRGTYGIVSDEERLNRFDLTQKLHKTSPWHVRFDGGESMGDVYGRFRDFQGTLHREEDNRRVLVVAHGDFINAARYGIERMLPEQWEALDADPTQTIRNCAVLQYSRTNPIDETDVRDKLHWRKMVYPTALDESPDAGNWVELADRRRFTGAELIGQIEIAPPLLGDATPYITD